MKTHIYKLATVVLATVFLHSCSVDDYKVEGELTEETLVKNEASAISALNGIYDSARPNGSKGILYATTGLLLAGIEQQKGINTSDDLQNFYNNDVKPRAVNDRFGLYGFYQKSYRTINLANFFIRTVEQRGIEGASEATKNSLIAQAKTLRANSYFMLLKVFGQFYDVSSEYGVVTTTKVIDGFTYLKRAKVNDTYTQIISDLEFAIKHSPNRGRDIVSKTFAKGLLAKVYLYKGGTENWAKTVSYCKDIIDNLGEQFELVSDYPTIFQQSFKSKEVIFAPYYSKSEPLSNPGALSFDNANVKPSKYFKDFADKLVKDETISVPKRDEYGFVIPGEFRDSLAVKYDPRYQFTFGKRTRNNTSQAYNKYPKVTASTFYFLRVAEVYLMYAEAIVRTDGDMQTAVDVLNLVRQRAYAASTEAPAPFTFTDRATLLEDIRKEKMLELHLETAETWFDLIRYDRLGDLKIGDLKPSITNVNQLIFPIPERVITNNSNFGKQNPNY